MTALPETQAPTAARPGIPTILIVDDHASTAKALAQLLASANYATAISLRGQEALTFADEHAIAAAVVDIHLPDINGLILTRQLRERIGPDKPIIILSGDTSMEVINSLPHVGATYFFSKPVNARQLLERLREWVGDPAAV